MKIIRDLPSYHSHSELVLAIGNFDGVHQGHKALLSSVLKAAEENRCLSAVMTFSNHPREILIKDSESIPQRLMSLEHKMYLLDGMGIDLCFLLPFTHAFSQTPAEDFVKRILLQKLKVKVVYLGRNARFGRNQEGDAFKMMEWAKENPFVFKPFDTVQIRGISVSSSIIRKAIVENKWDVVTEFLGRPYSVFAEVVRGEGRGRTLGYPTANLMPLSPWMIDHGVYSVRVRPVLDSFEKLYDKRQKEFNFKIKKSKRSWQGVLNFGKRPTFGKSEEIAEVHLLDFQGDLYGQSLEVEFLKRIRAEKAFSSALELSRQIQEDISEARKASSV